MKERTRQRIINKLERAQILANEAIELLDDGDEEKCDTFSSLRCDIDESIAEVENL